MPLHIDESFYFRSSEAVAKIRGLVAPPVYLKLEGLNTCGSIKLVPALQLLGDLENAGVLGPGSTVIESSSGNLGIALSAVCANKGYRFICVTDPNASAQSSQIMRAYGAEVIVVSTRDEVGGYLGARIKLIHEMCAKDPKLVWVNQYANQSNWLAHFNSTAKDISRLVPHIDWLFIGAGTTGTLMGCTRYFRKYFPSTKIVAVDTTGSVTFGGKPGPRHIPGLGTSRRPEIVDETEVDQIHYVDEFRSIEMCRRIARKGLLLGGSSGTVLSAITDFSSQIAVTDVVVTLSPDFGDKYLDTVYDDEWVSRKFRVVEPLDFKRSEEFRA